MAYKKPQDPLTNNGFGIYPLTTADQVILADGSRLEKNGVVSANIANAEDSSKLGGIAANSYALKTDTVSNSEKLGNVTASEYALKTDTAPDSSKLGGKTLAEIMLALYPVGAVYISVNSTSPASLFGGTWESIGGRFLLGADSTYTAGSTGGEATHKLTVNEIPSHAGHLYGNAG